MPNRCLLVRHGQPGHGLRVWGTDLMGQCVIHQTIVADQARLKSRVNGNSRLGCSKALG